MTLTAKQISFNNRAQSPHIHCGNCKGEHGSVAEVRACFQKDAARQPSTRRPVTEAGIYFLDGTVYKVQAAVRGSGRLYAKRLEGTSFVMSPGAVRQLHAEDKMTLEQARAYGAVYGVCCRCGRTLTDETSIAAGIGPVCAEKIE
jgi:hypothetical protein